MPDPEAIREIARDWLESAQEDLDAAQLYFDHPEEINPRIPAYHAQQAAEKAIKAVLVLEQSDVPRSHDLERLRALVPRPTALPTATELAPLSDYAVTSRYPDYPPTATGSLIDVAAALEVAMRAVDAASDHIAEAESAGE